MLEMEMLDKKVWAVVGANQNPDKYGRIIYEKLKEKGYEVFPVNPRYDEIDGNKCYKSLKSLPQKPDVVNMVVSPNLGREALEEAAELGIKYIWFQPGSYDEEILDLSEKLGLEIIQSCVLVATR